jgi:hypothetical protein
MYVYIKHFQVGSRIYFGEDGQSLILTHQCTLMAVAVSSPQEGRTSDNKSIVSDTFNILMNFI